VSGGLVTGINCGEVVIKATSKVNDEIYAEYKVTIKEEPIKEIFAEEIIISGSNSLYENETIDLTVRISPEDTTNKEVEWLSSDETIATVDANGKVKAISEGKVIITVTSLSDESVTDNIEITVLKNNIEPTLITLSFETTGNLYVGFKYKLEMNVEPENASKDVTFEVHPNSSAVGYIDDEGYAHITGEGIFRVRVKSNLNPDVKSSYTSAQAVEDHYNCDCWKMRDLKGYEIIIMVPEGKLSDYDPFLEGYNQPDKVYKQRAWRETEENWNCVIQVVPYPEEAPFGNERINWIIENANNNTSKADICVVPSEWIYQFANANAALDVSEIYGKHGFYQMEPALKEAGSYNGKVYVASTGISKTKTYVDLGLYYNYGWLKELGVESPAKMFNDGRWTYTNFTNWVLDVQSKLDENEYVLGGAPYYYWQGMSNAAGQIIANSANNKLNFISSKSIEAMNLMQDLVKEGAFNTNITWSESDDVPNSFWRTDGGTLMTTGYLSNIKNNIWSGDMWGEENTEFGYVPFPYPDDLAKGDTRISISSLDVYMYVKGRNYPSEMEYITKGYEKVWAVINEMFLNTIKYQEENPLYYPEEIVEYQLNDYLNDPESIKAVMYYNSKRVVYDSLYRLYDSVKDSPLVNATNNTMINGTDYMEEFNIVYEIIKKENSWNFGFIE